MAQRPALSFSHFGFYVRDLERMADFYTRVLGFAISDRGDLDIPRGNVSLVFLTRDPREHHQIVLASGRPDTLPFNPINQISFRMADFAGLREMHRLIQGERDAEPSPLPRAVHFDGEMMRVFETAGLATEVLGVIRPSGGIRHVNTAGQVMIERKPALETGPHGWANNYLFHHPHFEAVLRRGAERFVDVFYDEVQSISQSADAVQLQTRNRLVKARWAVGCDGARSMVRQAIGAAQ